MKKFKVLLALVFALAFTASAMAAATITWSGEAQVRAGYQGVWIDEADLFARGVLFQETYGYKPDFAAPGDVARFDDLGDSANFFGLKSETGVILRADIVANDNDRLTAGFEVEFQAVPEQFETESEAGADGTKWLEGPSRRPIIVQSAWTAYDFGPVVLTYNAANMQGRWDTSIMHIDDYSSGMSVDAKMPVEGLGYGFVTLMSDNAFSAVGYENTDLRIIPMVQAGFAYKSDMIDATVGGVLDKYDEDDVDYTGYMLFGDVAYKMGGNIGEDVGSLRVGFSFAYGQNISAFAAGDPNGLSANMLMLQGPVAGETGLISYYAAQDEDSTIMGARLHVAYTLWAGGILAYDARYSQVKIGHFGSDADWAGTIYQSISLTQALDANMFLTLGLGYERYERSELAGSSALDAAYGIEATCQVGYSF